MSSVSNTEDLSPSAEELRGRGIQEAARVYGDWLSSATAPVQSPVVEVAA